MSKQTTLFSSWGSRKKEPGVGNASTSNTFARPGPSTVSAPFQGSGKPVAPNNETVVDLCDEDDDDILLAMAMQESLVQPQPGGKVSKIDDGASSSSKKTSLFNMVRKQPSIFEQDITEDCDMIDITEVTNIESLPGFDNEAGKIWIYPTNYPVRDYQYNIVKQALFKNTLVVLPTGLGKTFIAAVVMYNFYRWYPQGKIVFMAPTKPLVAQQIEACYNIMGIPQEDTAEMTGAMQPAERKKSWIMKRMFFLTPQVLTNDLSRGACPSQSLKCLVIDEAHKALGNHAYCQVVKELAKQSSIFRVLALSATPGSDIKAVQQVITNLMISHVELRSEDSIDIKQYSHERKVEKIVVPLGPELSRIQGSFLQVIEVFVKRLKAYGVLYHREAKSLSKFFILKARDQFRQDPPQKLQRHQYGMVEGEFALCMSLYHGYELLQQHGLRSLHSYLESLMSGEKGCSKTKHTLQSNQTFCNLMEELRNKFDPVKAPNLNTQFSPMRASQLSLPYAVGHPKMEKLREIVLAHFQKCLDEQGGEGSPKTRVMIFSQYRDSVNEITEMLHRHRPLVMVMSFIGQSSAGKTSKGFSQKEQLKVMRNFREGGYNTLVSTCVGEEGLDIGDVDLIICFDAHKSPIRLVQRMGRTGRKREGRIVMLVTKGKEEQIYNQSLYSKKSIHKAILNGASTLKYYPNNSRMVPAGLQPACHKIHITVKEKFKAQSKSKAQSKISSAIEKAVAVRQASSADGFLTSEELRYWDEHLKVPSDEVKSIPSTSTLLSLKSSREHQPAHTESSGGQFDLSEWTSWQNRLQKAHISGHSVDSVHMVELMEFMELQATIGNEHDPYGLEMHMYLNKEDIIESAPQVITKFCSSVNQDKKQADPQPRERKDLHGKVKGIRRSKQLPPMELEDPVRSSDEDDLPEFDLKNKKPKPTRPKSISDSESEADIKNLTDCSLNSDSDKSTSAHGNKYKESKVIKNKKHKEKDSCNSSVIKVLSDHDELDFDDGKKSRDASPVLDKTYPKEFEVENSAKFKHSERDSPFIRYSSKTGVSKSPDVNVDLSTIQTSCVPKNKEQKSPKVSACSTALKDNTVSPKSDTEIAVIDVDNSPEQIKLQTVDKCKKVVPKSIKSANNQAQNKAKVVKETAVNPQQKTLNQLGFSGGIHKEHVPVNINDLSLSQLLPMENISISEFDESMKAKDYSGCGVPKPPSQEEFQKTIQYLQEREQLSPVDLVTLVDQWQKEKTPINELQESSCKRNLNFDEDVNNEEDERKFHRKVSVSEQNIVINSTSHKMDKPSTSKDIEMEIETVPETVEWDIEEEEKETNKAAVSFMDVVNDDKDDSFHNSSPSSSPVFQSQASGNKPFKSYKTQNNLTAIDVSTSKPIKTPKSLQLSTKRKNVNVSEKREEVITDNIEEKSKVTAGQDNEDPYVNSFFDCSNDDSFLRHFKTPKSFVSPVGSTQVTFSQALDMLCESDTDPVTPEKKKLNTPVKRDGSIQNDTSVSSHKYSNSGSLFGELAFEASSESQASAGFNLSPKDAAKTKWEKNKFEPNKSELEPVAKTERVVDKIDEQTEKQEGNINDERNNNDASFDLGFDLDFDDDDMIIPPSPEHAASVGFNKTSARHSQISNTLPVDKLLERNTKTVPPISVQIDNYSSAAPSKSSTSSNENTSPSIITSSMVPPSQKKLPHSVLPTPVRQELANLSEDIFEDSMVFPASVKKPKPLNVAHVTPIIPKSMSVMATSTPTLPPVGVQKRIESPKLILSPEADKSDEDSFIQIVKKRKKLQVISPETPDIPTAHQADEEFKTPVKPPERSKKRPKALISSDDDTPVKPKAKRLLTLPEVDTSEDDDFIDYNRNKGTSRLTERILGESKQERLKNNVKKKKTRCAFIEEEADLSEDGEGVSSDEAEEGLDHYDPSFLNDASQVSHSQQVLNDTDMHAVYMKSVRSPHMAHIPSRFKLQYDYDRHLDVFSQAPAEDEGESRYEEDSFCVNSDYMDEEESASEEEILPVKRKKRKRSKVVSDKGRKRVILHESSSEDEKVTSLNVTEIEPQNRSKVYNQDIKSKSRKGILDTSSSTDHDATSPTPSGITQIPPLRERLMKKFNDTDKSTYNSVVGMKNDTLVKSTDVVRNCDKVSDNFDLGLDDLFDDDFDMDKNIEKISSNTSSNKTDVTNSKVLSSTFSLPREERIRKSRELQMKFRQKQRQGSAANLVTPVAPSSDLKDNTSEGITPCSDTSLSISHRLTVLVDSREINSAQDLVSALRLKHTVDPVVCQLTACDYIVSNRMGVERKNISDFCNGANKNKLIERIRHMCDLFDRPIIIIEKDRVKAGEEKHAKTMNRTKYVDSTLACLVQLHIKVFYSDNQEDSASILYELAQQEARKSKQIQRYTELSAAQEQVLKFYLSIPKVNYAIALNLVYKFRTIRDVIHATVETLESSACVTAQRASEIQRFLKHSYDPMLVATKK